MEEKEEEAVLDATTMTLQLSAGSSTDLDKSQMETVPPDPAHAKTPGLLGLHFTSQK
jgi:hypothetical protein